MSREDLHFRLRIPEDLKKKVEKAAEENRRSMTAEIVARLEASFLFGDLQTAQRNITSGWEQLEIWQKKTKEQLQEAEQLANQFSQRTKELEEAYGKLPNFTGPSD